MWIFAILWIYLFTKSLLFFHYLFFSLLFLLLDLFYIIWRDKKRRRRVLLLRFLQITRIIMVGLTNCFSLWWRYFIFWSRLRNNTGLFLKLNFTVWWYFLRFCMAFLWLYLNIIMALYSAGNMLAGLNFLSLGLWKATISFMISLDIFWFLLCELFETVIRQFVVIIVFALLLTIYTFFRRIFFFLRNLRTATFTYYRWVSIATCLKLLNLLLGSLFFKILPFYFWEKVRFIIALIMALFLKATRVIKIFGAELIMVFRVSHTFQLWRLIGKFAFSAFVIFSITSVHCDPAKFLLDKLLKFFKVYSIVF